MATRIAQIASLPVLLFLVTAAAWAGRGDIDPNYGEGGRVSISPSVQLALPGDRLVVGEGTGDGFRVRMVDATGRNVPAFGDGGVVLIDSSAAARTFQPQAAAFAPNGDMIFLGSLSDTGAQELLRLDNDGQPVLAFGNRGDGFVELTLTTTARVIVIDPDGKIVLAEGSTDPDNNCVSTARLQRLLADGQSDAAFGGDGLIEIPNLNLCWGTAVFGARADGSVIVGDGHTIVAVDAAGDIDPAFGVDGRLTVTDLASTRGLLLPDGGLLLFGSSDESATSNDTLFLKFDRNGQPDLNFAGTGSVTVDLGGELLGDPSIHENVGQLVLDPDGEHIVAGLSFLHDDGSLVCGGIARLSIDGAPDTTFGRNGLTCLNLNFAVTAVQSDGAPLFFAGNDDAIHRLLPDNSPSPGFLRVVATSVTIDESDGTATVAIERLAGRDGAVNVNYTTAYRGPCHRQYQCWWDSATAGSDYTAASGRLDWASGDDSQRTVTVNILNDDIVEYREIFGVDFSEAGGGVQLIAVDSRIFITDNDVAPPPPPPPPPAPPPASGGGGSVSWATLFALLTLLFISRRRVRRADQLRHCEFPTPG